jgi:hypothetical protein
MESGLGESSLHGFRAWVHCHIAMQPIPAGERSKNVPTSVAAIIMKLLARTAEER